MFLASRHALAAQSIEGSEVRMFRVTGQWTATEWKQEFMLRASSAARAREIAERAGFQVLKVERASARRPGRSAEPRRGTER
jgi:hypothetical protein